MKIKRIKPLLEQSKRLKPVQADRLLAVIFMIGFCKDGYLGIKIMEVIMKRAGESPALCFGFCRKQYNI